jgi:hypothetical protein
MVVKKKKVTKKSKKKISRKMKNDLTIHFMAYSEIANKDSLGRVKKIMDIVLKNKIVILQGKLRPDEEVKLIENSMLMIGNIPGFAGVEVASLSNENENRTLFQSVRRNIARILVGEQDAITIVGPAAVVKEMTKDPEKVELMLARK